MKDIALFALGGFAGVGGTLLLLLYYNLEPPPSVSLSRNSSESDGPPQVAQPLCEQRTATQANVLVADTVSAHNTDADINALLNTIKAGSNISNGREFLELIYLIRNNKQTAQMVKNTILESDSYDERYTLLRVLAHDTSPETVEFGIDMIQTPNDETKQLGLELLATIGSRENIPKLSQALLETTYDETDPEILAHTIARLSQIKLNTLNKNNAVERFQYFLSSHNPRIKARAIDGLSTLGDPAVILATASDNLNHIHEDIRISAISALLSLESSMLDDAIIDNLVRLTHTPNNTDRTQNAALAVLDFHQK